MLRKQMLAARTALSGDDQTRLSAGAQAALIQSPWFNGARTILLYQPFRGEVATGEIIAAAVAAGKRLALTRVQKEPRRLWMHEYGGDPGALVSGAYGLKEPDPSWPLVEPGEIDLVVVPGVAFDRQGNRLGYGGGYYDRLLPELRAANPEVVLVGLAYGFQMVAEMPSDPHDVPVDAVATESGLWDCRKGG